MTVASVLSTFLQLVGGFTVLLVLFVFEARRWNRTERKQARLKAELCRSWRPYTTAQIRQTSRRTRSCDMNKQVQRG